LKPIELFMKFQKVLEEQLKKDEEHFSKLEIKLLKSSYFA